MKAAVLRAVNDELSAHTIAKEHSIDRKTLVRYIDKFTQDEHSEMKPNYVIIRVVNECNKM